MMGMNWIDDYLKAGSLRTSKEDLAKLASHENYRIRQRVAENPKTQREILETLSNDKHSEVRIAVATNRNCPIDVVYQLAYDDDPTVRLGLADDVNAPPGVLRILLSDENPYVVCHASKTIEKLGMTNKVTFPRIPNLEDEKIVQIFQPWRKSFVN